MRNFSLSFWILGVASLALLAGCESSGDFSSRLQERFEAPKPQVRVFEVEQRKVFEAAQEALKRMDFTVTRAAAAQGVIKAHSQIQPANALNEARQYALEVTIEDVAEGKTQVSAVLREQQESASFSGATDIAVREHGLYDSFFELIAMELKAKLPAGEAGK